VKKSTRSQSQGDKGSQGIRGLGKGVLRKNRLKGYRRRKGKLRKKEERSREKKGGKAFESTGLRKWKGERD